SISSTCGHRQEQKDRTGKDSIHTHAIILAAPARAKSTPYFNKSLRVREASQRFPCYAKYRPLIHRDGAKILVELDRRLVPIENGPLESATIPFARDSRQFNQHGPAKPLTAHLWNDEQIFEVETGPANKSREIVEEDCKCDRLLVSIAEQNFCISPGPKQILP